VILGKEQLAAFEDASDDRFVARLMAHLNRQ
jgi:hypothetical protein